MTRTRLAPVDAAWLQMEEPDNLMMITAVLRFGDRLDVGRLAGLLERRLVDRYPRFAQRLTGVDTGFGRAAWVDVDDFSVDDHLTEVSLSAPGDETALRQLVSGLISRPLDLERPPWHLHVVSGLDGGGSALVARLHHSIADGMALAAVLLDLTDERSAERDRDAESGTGGAPSEPRGDRLLGLLRRAATGAATAGRVVAELVRLLASPSDPDSALRGDLSRRKAAGWSDALPLDRVKAVAEAASVTVNDVLLAVAAGALRRAMLDRGEATHDVRASVPVNLRPLDEPVPRDLGNRFGLVFVPLPLSLADPADRLSTVSAGMDAQKGSAQAAMAFAVLTVLGRAPKIAEKVMVKVVGAKTSCVVTNVPGPSDRLTLAGSTIDGILFWVPQAGRVALGISVFSYAGAVSVGVASDAEVFADPQAVAEAVPGELDALARAVGLGSAAAA